MTITFRFFAAAAPRTNGLALSKVDPNATPAALRRKSRRLRPRCSAIFLPKEDWAVNSHTPHTVFTAWWKDRPWLHRQTAEPPPFPYQPQPCAAPGAADRLQTPPGHDPFARCARSPGRGGSGRQEDLHSIPALAGIQGSTSRTHAGQHIDCPAAHAVRGVPGRA